MTDIIRALGRNAFAINTATQGLSTLGFRPDRCHNNNI